MEAKDIAAKVTALVGGERRDVHGLPVRECTIIAELMNGFLRGKYGASFTLTAEDVGVFNVLSKVARTASGTQYDPDHYVDIAGWGCVTGEIAAAGRST